MAPTVQVLRTLTKAVSEAPMRHNHMASADSVALHDRNFELNVEPRMREDEPLSCGLSLSGMTLAAASDYGRCFADMFTLDRAPVFGHLVVTRAALEACVVARWLSDTSVTSEVRAKRAVCALIYSAEEQKRLRLPELTGNGKSLDRWAGLAARLQWDIGSRNRKPLVDDVTYPPTATAIGELLGGTTAGSVQWSYLSAVVHGTWYGLREGILGEPAPDPVSGSTVAPVGTSSQATNTHALCLIRAVRVAASERMRYMGWIDDTWAEAHRDARNHETTLITTYRLANPQSSDKG